MDSIGCNNFFNNFLFNYLLRKIDVQKIKNQLNIVVSIWDYNKLTNIKPK
jgi:hypothetical protein